jgi:hypothetical protein
LTCQVASIVSPSLSQNQAANAKRKKEKKKKPKEKKRGDKKRRRREPKTKFTGHSGPKTKRAQGVEPSPRKTRRGRQTRIGHLAAGKTRG